MDESNEAILSDVNFDLKHNDMLTVVGQVGAGKTTLLHAIMEEAKTCSGQCSIKGTIAYVE